MALKRRINDSLQLKAGALYFVIFLLFLMTILLASFILFIHFKNQLIIRQVGIAQIEQNIESALELYSVKPSILDKNSSFTKAIFTDVPSDVNITQEAWGVYSILRFKGRYKELERTRFALLGFKYGSIQPTALYMTDKDRYLSICGNSKVIGNCYLPKLGMRTARIEGKLFSGIMENRDGYIHQSAGDLPAPPEPLIENCQSIINGSANGIIRSSETLVGVKRVFNSFADSLQIYTSASDFWVIDNISISGKVELYSNKEIYVNPSAKLNNVIIAGRKVVVKSGFEGCVQIFASDTIILEENVRLQYPSSISVIDSKTNQKLIFISLNSEVQGAVWIWNPVNDNKYLPVIKLETGSIVKGQVYCSGRIQLKGDIWGTLIADQFFLNTPNAYYENYIFNSTIDSEKLPSEFACLPFVFDYEEMQFINWLY
jgi:cytoskeletal protein CcmA (bactofilin family)